MAPAAYPVVRRRRPESGDACVQLSDHLWLNQEQIGVLGLFAGGFTLGGLATTLDAEVLHVSGDPIPGLFAAGRSTAGLAAWGYASGISLGDGSFYGRRAGRCAAKG